MLPPSNIFPPSAASSDSPFAPDLSEGAEVGVYLALLELIDEGLIITGDEAILDANSAACRLLEKEYRDVVGQPLSELFVSEKAFLEARARLLIQGDMRGSLRIALPGDRHRDVRFIAAARLRPGIHALILSPDYLAEGQETQDLKADHIWPRLAAALSQPVLVIDASDKVVAANEAALRELETSQKNLIGQSATTYFGLDGKGWSGPLIKVRLPGRTVLTIARLLDGPHPNWHLLILPPTENSEIQNISPPVFDVFQYSEQVMVVCNADRQMVRVNPAFTRLLGYEQDEISGKTLDMLAARHLPAILNQSEWHEIAESGVWQGERWCQHKNGKALPVWVSIVSTSSTWGGAERYIMTMTDLTAQRWRESRARHFSGRDDFNPPDMVTGWLTDFEQSLPLAVKNQQLEIHLQPLVDGRNEEVCGGEVLLRWHHPQWGVIPFRRFIGAARDSLLIAQLGDWTLNTACRTAKDWSTSGQRPLELTVNVAVEQMMQPGFLDRVELALSSSGLAPERLELDLDERILQEDTVWVSSVLSDLKAMGVRLALDDFGCGAGMLLKLGHYPFSAIKLDPLLVRDVGKDAHSEVVIEAITQWAATFGLRVFARGVESRGQQAFLTALGCHFQQGPLFGPPLGAAAFTTMFVNQVHVS